MMIDDDVARQTGRLASGRLAGRRARMLTMRIKLGGARSAIVDGSSDTRQHDSDAVRPRSARDKDANWQQCNAMPDACSAAQR
jgi:hypothetical protein